MSLYSVKALLVITNTERIAAKYYDKTWSTFQEQRKFESKIITQRSGNQADSVIFDDVLVLYRLNMGTFFCVVGSIDENPLILESVLEALYQSITALLRGQVDKRTLLENLDYILLAMDEAVDEGILLEPNHQFIVQRVALRNSEEVPLSEQTFAQAFQSAKVALDSFFK